MKILVTLLAAAVTATGPLAANGSLTATLVGSGHAPKINAHWPYAVHVSINRKPAPARITVQIVDPIGAAHAVQFGTSTRNVTNYKIKGVFRDFIVWPASAQGVPLKLRVTVVTTAGRKVLSYSVVPRA